MKKGTNRRKYRLLEVVVCVIFIWLCIPIKAANYVTVATIGKMVPKMDQTQKGQKMVNKVKEFWYEELEQVIPDKPDLIVLTENCDIPLGLTDKEKDEYLRVRKNQIQDFFASRAKENHCYIAFGTLREKEDGSWRNSCIIDREGKIAGIYNKNFPTVGEMENGIRAGTEAPVFQCDFGRVACVICFDLNFNELLRAYMEEKPDIIVFPSMYHGGLVQSYWAYSCRSFFVGSMGFRENPSEIRNPLGNVIASSTNYFDFAVARINLDCRLVHLDGNWVKLEALKKKYGEKVIITDPGRLGSVLITSEHKHLSAMDMIKEFDIELVDNYFKRSREFRLKQGNIGLDF